MAAKIISRADTRESLSSFAAAREHARAETAAGYDAVATAWDTSRQTDWGEFIFLQKLLSASPQKKCRILDAGCGNGRLLSFLTRERAAFEYLGVDASAGLLAKAREAFPAHAFRHVDLVNLKCEATFTLVTSIAVVHHLPRADQLIVFKNLHAALAPDGILFLTVWNLWQPRYLKFVLLSYFFAVLDFFNFKKAAAEKRQPRDCRIPFQKKWQRQVFAFTANDLLRLAADAGFHDIEVFGTAGAKKAGIFSARNITLIART